MVNAADQTISLNGWSSSSLDLDGLLDGCLNGWMLSIVDNNCLRGTKGPEWRASESN